MATKSGILHNIHWSNEIVIHLLRQEPFQPKYYTMASLWKDDDPNANSPSEYIPKGISMYHEGEEIFSGFPHVRYTLLSEEGNSATES